MAGIWAVNAHGQFELAACVLNVTTPFDPIFKDVYGTP